MKADVLPYLRCTICGEKLAAAGGGPQPRALRCPAGHSFDIARQGYVHLGTGRSPHAGDSPEMVAARADFLAAGHYDVISAALAQAAREHTAGEHTAGEHGGGGLVVDVGAGTGRHLGAVLDALPGAVGLALDVAKPALRRAARAHPRAGAALCDTWRRLPLADGGTDLLLNVFAPRNGVEFRRVLRPDGLLLVVTPEPDHLTELVAQLGLLTVDPDKPGRLATSLGPGFAPAGDAVHRWRLRLGREHVKALVGMGPSAWHTAPAELAARLATLPEETAVTAAVRLRRYRTHADRS